MNYGRDFVIGIVSLFAVLFIGFSNTQVGKILSTSIVVYFLIFVTFINIAITKLVSLKIDFIKQYDVVVKIEPKGKSMFFVRAYDALVIMQCVLMSSLVAIAFIILANKGNAI